MVGRLDTHLLRNPVVPMILNIALLAWPLPPRLSSLPADMEEFRPCFFFFLLAVGYILVLRW